MTRELHELRLPYSPILLPPVTISNRACQRTRHALPHVTSRSLLIGSAPEYRVLIGSTEPGARRLSCALETRVKELGAYAQLLRIGDYSQSGEVT